MDRPGSNSMPNLMAVKRAKNADCTDLIRCETEILGAGKHSLDMDIRSRLSEVTERRSLTALRYIAPQHPIDPDPAIRTSKRNKPTGIGTIPEWAQLVAVFPCPNNNGDHVLIDRERVSLTILILGNVSVVDFAVSQLDTLAPALMALHLSLATLS
jgi:hypothetical protein